MNGWPPHQRSSQRVRATIHSLGHRDEDGRAFSLERAGWGEGRGDGGREGGREVMKGERMEAPVHDDALAVAEHPRYSPGKRPDEPKSPWGRRSPH